MGPGGGVHGRSLADGLRQDGHPLLQPPHPGVQGREVAGEPLVAQAQQTELRVRPAVGAVVEVRGAFLQRRGEVEEALGGLALAEPLQSLGVKAAGEQGGAALGRGLAEEQVPDQGGELPQHGADVLAALIELIEL